MCQCAPQSLRAVATPPTSPPVGKVLAVDIISGNVRGAVARVMLLTKPEVYQ